MKSILFLKIPLWAIFISLLLPASILAKTTDDIRNHQDRQIKEWIVIGAGPAGIAVVGKLLDANIGPMNIGWIDPMFKVGDLGTKWYPVSSNTKVDLFLKFLNASHAFNYKNCPTDFKLNHLPDDSTCLLKYVVDPLQWVTNQLKQKVHSFKTTATKLKYSNNIWEVETKNGIMLAKNVVLAIGSEPLTLPLSGPKIIPIENVVNLDLLKKSCTKEDTVAVFGSSHTAIIALYNLTSVGAKIINFYRSPLKYAVYYDDWILYDNTGLKGYSAEWAKKNIDEKLLPNIERVHINDKRFKELFAKCNKVVYAVGFKRRDSIQVPNHDGLKYDENTGVIAPGLFGIGFAFPKGKSDKVGNYEYDVGLWKFMTHLENVLPLWFHNSSNLGHSNKEYSINLSVDNNINN